MDKNILENPINTGSSNRANFEQKWHFFGTLGRTRGELEVALTLALESPLKKLGRTNSQLQKYLPVPNIKIRWFLA